MKKTYIQPKSVVVVLATKCDAMITISNTPRDPSEAEAPFVRVPFDNSFDNSFEGWDF